MDNTGREELLLEVIKDFTSITYPEYADEDNIKEKIQELYPNNYKTTSIFFENLYLSNIDLQEEVNEDFIIKIQKKLKEIFDIRTDLDIISYTSELLKFIEFHS